MQKKRTPFQEGLVWFGLWLLLAILAGLLAYQIYATVLLGGTALTASQFRPRYWDFTRIKWLGRFMSLVVGAGWIFFISFAESIMRIWHKRDLLVPNSLRLAGQMAIASLVLYALAQLVVFIP